MPLFDFGSNKGLCPLFQSPLFGVSSVVQNLIKLLGLITRSQAEELLDEKEVHSFLIRLSDKVWGYTISYRCEERIKHFLIDACHFKKVKFDGNSEKLHKDLHALISFHEVGSYKLRVWSSKF